MQNDCFPEAATEWSKITIGQIAEIDPNYRLAKGHEYPFIEMAAISSNFEGIQRLDFRKMEVSGLSKFKPGDTLFAKITPCPQNGKIAYVEDLPDEIGLGSTEFIVLSAKNNCHPKFLFYLLCCHSVRGRAIARMEGSTGRQRIPDDLEAIEHRKYAQIPEKKAKPYQLNYGDVLIVRGNANPDLVGKAGIVCSFPEGCIYPDITKRVVFRDTGEDCVLPEYAVLVWNHSVVHNQVLRRAKTSNGTLKINNRDVKQIVMPVAPRKEQENLVSLVQAVDKKVLALSEKLTAQGQLKRALMHDLLTGKMRVNAAELASVVQSLAIGSSAGGCHPA